MTRATSIAPVEVMRRRGWQRFPRVRGCVAKVLYTKARYARIEAERQGLYAYRCTYCKGWHLTRRRPA